MRDPHVESLRYRVVSQENFSYHQPPPVEVDYPEFSGRLEDGLLTCNMKKHYSSVKEAENAIKRYLRAWEIFTDIKYGRAELRFQALSDKAKVVDRNPPPPGFAIMTELPSEGGLVFGGSSIESVTRRQYPDAPGDFKWSPDVETLYHRYEMYLEGKEPLQSMAYFCLTLADVRYGTVEVQRGRSIRTKRRGGPSKRRVAASRLNISFDVLRKLGDLSTEKGENRTARKALLAYIPLSGREREWIEAAIKVLILRIGEKDSDSNAPLTQIMMASLPTLGP